MKKVKFHSKGEHMKKLAVLVLMFAFAIPVVAEDVVSEAQQQILKEKHADRLTYAKRLLGRKAQLEKDLAQVNSDLQNVVACDNKDQGWLGTSCKEDSVPLASGPAAWTISNNNAGVFTTTGTITLPSTIDLGAR